MALNIQACFYTHVCWNIYERSVFISYIYQLIKHTGALYYIHESLVMCVNWSIIFTFIHSDAFYRSSFIHCCRRNNNKKTSSVKALNLLSLVLSVLGFSSKCFLSVQEKRNNKREENPQVDKALKFGVFFPQSLFPAGEASLMDL